MTTVPQGQFLTFRPSFRFDCNNTGGGTSVREDIPTNILGHDFPTAESFFVEIILHKKKRLINCPYNANKNGIKNHLEISFGTLEIFTTKYKNILLLCDFNACPDDETMKNFCSSYGLHSLIKQPTSVRQHVIKIPRTQVAFT